MTAAPSTASLPAPWTAPPGHKVCLTLLVPEHAQDRIVDFLLTHDRDGIEFSLHAVNARGPLVRLDSHEEMVRGFATRTEVKLILDRERCAALLPPLTQALAGLDGGYWLTEVQQFERFATARSVP